MQQTKPQREIIFKNMSTQDSYRRVASIALSSPTILRLLPRPNFPRIRPAAGISVSSQCLKTAFISRGTPSMTTVVTGIKGRSSSETARMPYSCAKRSAVEKAWLCVRESAPMMLGCYQYSSLIFYKCAKLTCTSRRKHPVHRCFLARDPSD